MTALTLFSFGGFDLKAAVGTPVSGLTPMTAPQRSAGGAQYGFGSSGGAGEFTADQVVMQRLELASAGTASIAVLTGTQANPCGESPAQLATVKEFYIEYLRLSADGTAGATVVTAALDANLAAALGFSAAVSKTLMPGERWSVSCSAGRATAGSSTITLTNAAGAKATVVVGLAGWHP